MKMEPIFMRFTKEATLLRSKHISKINGKLALKGIFPFHFHYRRNNRHVFIKILLKVWWTKFRYVGYQI